MSTTNCQKAILTHSPAPSPTSQPNSAYLSHQAQNIQEDVEEQCVEATTRYDSLPGLAAFCKSDVFLVSDQYHGAFRGCLLAAIRYLGGSVALGEGVEGKEYFLVSRDQSCAMPQQLPKNHSYEWITHIYIFACCDFESRLPLLTFLHWTPGIMFPPPSSEYWTAIFPSSSSDSSDNTRPSTVASSSTTYSHYSTIAHCFAPLYRPLPSSAHATGGVPDMGSLVICITGFSSLKLACTRWLRIHHHLPGKRRIGNMKRKFQEEDIQDNDDDDDDCTFQLQNKSGALELQHAIRLCGASLMRPFIPSLVTHLVCASPFGRKHTAAVTYNDHVKAVVDTGKESPQPVHIVSEDWLFDSLRRWQRQDEAQYRVQHSAAVDTAVPDVVAVPLALTPPSSENDTAADRHDSLALMTDAPIIIREGSAGTEDSSLGGELGVRAYYSNVTENDEPPSEHSELPLSLSPQPVVSSSSLFSQQSSSQSQKLEVKYFMFGSCSSERSERAQALLERLGGVILSSDKGSYDPQCTHLLLWKFERTEKCMCACAAGKWVLYPDEYLAECEKKDALVPEEPFEWFAPSDAQIKRYHYNPLKAPWLGTCRRGRERRYAQSLPFSELPPVAFITSEDLRPPLGTMRTLLLAGGGTITTEYSLDQYCEEFADAGVVGGTGGDVITESVDGEEKIRYIVCSISVQTQILQRNLRILSDCYVQPNFITDIITTQLGGSGTLSSSDLAMETAPADHSI